MTTQVVIEMIGTDYRTLQSSHPTESLSTLHVAHLLQSVPATQSPETTRNEVDDRSTED